MSATDDLRALLNERGVEWCAGEDEYDRKTHWESNGLTWEYFNDDNGDAWLGFLGACESDVSPEQAVEATLGRGTCHPIISDNLTESEGTGDAWADCSECGHLLFVLTDPNSEPPNYCPNCGKEVEP